MALTVRPKIAPTAIGPGGLPTYTRAQLAQVHPNIPYPKYISYLTKNRTMPGPPWPGRGGIGTNLPTIESMIQQVDIESPAQVQARANAMTAATIKAQQGLVGSNYANEAALAATAKRNALAEDARRMQAQAAAGRAAAALNQDLFGRVGGSYNLGAQELSGLATGGVSDLTDTTTANTQRTNEALAALGQGPIDYRMAGPQQAAVADFQAGLGAKNLVNQGEAANFGLAGLITSQNLRSTQEAIAGQNQADRTAEQAYTDAVAQAQRTRAAAQQAIVMGRPDIAAKYLSQLQDANRQQIALGSTLLQQRRAALQAGFNQSMTQAQFDWQKQHAQDVLTQTKQISDAQLKAASQKIADKNAMPNPQLSRTTGALVDANGQLIMDKNGNPIILPGFRWDPVQNRIVKAYKPGTGPGSGNKKVATPGEIQSFMNSLKKTNYVSITQRDPNNKGNSQTGRVQNKKTPFTFTMQFPQAYKRLTTWGGLSDQEARRYLQSVYDRGQGGRDWLTNEEQTALAKAPAVNMQGSVNESNVNARGPGGEKPRKLYTHARTYKDKQGNTHGYLTEYQADALNKAGILPPGEANTFNGEPIWIISPGS